MREVFLSHASQDQTKTQWLRDVLVAHGVQVWFSPQHIRGAQQWQDEVGLALRRCDWFMALLTPRAVASMWVKRELSFALIDRRYENQILPLLLEDCDFQDLSWTLTQFQLINFRRDKVRACGELLRVWKQELKKRTYWKSSVNFHDRF